MADGWDLNAVVRSCSTAMAAATTTITNPFNNNIENPFPNLASLTHRNDESPFYFSNFIDSKDYSFQGLEDIYKEFYVNPQPITTSQITLSSSIPVLEGFESQEQTQQPQQRQQLERKQQQQQPQLKSSCACSSLTFPTTSSQTNRSRRRKNQQTKMVREMTQEELSADSWAWRKYGQKPIKGSPYPRNYYRCSTSKGCAAKKQVERSPSDSTIFIVYYAGEHTHPRPTHRSSLAGSTRNKFSAVNKPNSSESNAAPKIVVPKPSCSSSSPASASSYSPTTPLMEGENATRDNTQKETMDIENDDVERMEEVGDDEDILIPNTVMTEDIFKGFQELGGGLPSPNVSDPSEAIGDEFLCNLLPP